MSQERDTAKLAKEFFNLSMKLQRIHEKAMRETVPDAMPLLFGLMHEMQQKYLELLSKHFETAESLDIPMTVDG